MKKILSIFIAFSLCICCFSTNLFAETNDEVFYYNDKEITILDSSIDYAMKQKIADFIAGEHNHVSTYAVSCLLGHDYATSIATQVEHNVYEDYYKCVETTYEVEYCTRACGYMVKTVLTEFRIASCHG
ncbi:MAG: hypothetical protein IJZ89_05260 [Clostridia bacterium]|nr:hypothetical protein [Clostridia bacterium]